MPYTSGEKPGKGRYVCRQCGEDLYLDDDTDALPACAKCSGSSFLRGDTIKEGRHSDREKTNKHVDRREVEYTMAAKDRPRGPAAKDSPEKEIEQARRYAEQIRGTVSLSTYHLYAISP